ncbi:MAG TPA: DUF3482 domain-containing protein [Casimicrobiaceae bacterium]|nr:DUF3482 domain-containing protein [Casimicrobiaceae bacterium]
MNGVATAIALSLISHTNAGKTTLARTLLGRDVGEVRDAPNVTVEATPYPMISTPEGDTLVLWDTPGFGDSTRLARRLAQQGNPIGWFLSQVWDRFRDRAFWLSQQAVANVRNESDVVLYLVNASETPSDAGYVAPEMDVLAWIGKPVIVLLNQTGKPRPHDEEAADEARWREAFGTRPLVRAVVSLDAFARCWVQEIALLRLIGDVLDESKRSAHERLVRAWQRKRFAQFDQAMHALADPIARAACDSEPVVETGFKRTLVDLGRAIGLRKSEADDPRTAASNALASRLDADIRAGTDRLIAIHDLSGHASQVIRERLAGVELDAPMDEGKAAMMGGVVSGALGGLAADLAAGGLTFGAGILTGAILGALGGAGIARGMNLATGATGAKLRWDDALLQSLIAPALLRYLAVAHYGRGRGEWVETEYPPFWAPLVTRIVDARSATFSAVWSAREQNCDVDAFRTRLHAALTVAARETLEALYAGRVDWDAVPLQTLEQRHQSLEPLAVRGPQ